MPDNDSYIGRRPAGEGSVEISPVWGLDMGDQDFWAKSLIDAKKRRKGTTLVSHDLENAITGIRITDTIKGSSTVAVSFEDPDWSLVDTGFFDVNHDGKLDTFEVNYPDNSRLWWRCTQVKIDASRAGARIEMTFMERTAVYLLRRRGPKKARRGKTTRAEFLKGLTDEVKAGGGIKFRSRQLHKRQPIGRPPEEETPKKSESDKKEDKDPGLHGDDDISFTNWDGANYTLDSAELRNANEVLAACEAAGANERATLCALAACIVEAPFFRNPSGGDLDSVGILQLRSTWGTQAQRKDIGRSVTMFLKQGFYGLRDPSAKGAMDLERKHPDWSIGQICQETQGSAFPDRYQKVVDGARQVLEGGGGASAGGAGGHYEKSPYNFEVGSTENPRESYWDAMNRLADEVKWALFIDGRNVYYDPETSLIRQKPAAVIRRLDPDVVAFSATWDTREIATEATLELICSPFEFRAGDVLMLRGFGPASSGSNVKLPGRWLISEIERDRFDLVSRFTLKQPERPGAEPANEREWIEDEAGSTGADASVSGPVRQRIVQIAKNSMAGPPTTFYSQGGALTEKVHPARGERSDCSQWVRACYLKAGAGEPGTYTGDMLGRAKRTSNPKPGDIYLSSSHVELYIGGGKTIGHGSDPIDYATVAWCTGSMGMSAYTYDFLGQEDRQVVRRPAHAAGSRGQQRPT